MAYSADIIRQQAITGATIGRAFGVFKAVPSLTDFADEELAVKAAAGSPEHFEALVRRYSAAMYRLAYRFSGNKADAEDIVQEAFIKLFRALPKSRPDAPFRPWLYKIATNTAISHLRKRKSRHLVEIEDARSQIVAGDSAEAAGSRIDVQRALDSLPPDYRVVVILRAVEDLTFADISSVLDIPAPTARTRFSRAKTLLRSLVEE